MIRIRLPLIVAFATAILLAFGVAAQTEADTETQPQGKWQLRFGVVAVDTDGGVIGSSAPGAVNVRTDVGTDIGGAVSMERRITPLVGIEFEISGSALDLGVRVDTGADDVSTSLGMVTFTPISVGANFHLVGEGPVDVYFGPMLSLVWYRDLTVWTGTNSWGWSQDESSDWSNTWVRWESESDLTWGARLGADFAVGNGGWSVQTCLSYFDTSYRARNHVDESVTLIKINPLMFSIGAGFRF